MSRIITIGRTFGSGGREIARRLAQSLSIAYYDQEIVKELISRSDMADEYIRHVEEKRPLPLLPITTARTFSLSTHVTVEQNLRLYNEESNIIREFAEKGDGIFVGRCADYVLAQMKPVRLFIYADMDSRIARCRLKEDDTEGVSDTELKKKIENVDKTRSRYYRFYTGRTWSDKDNYDLMINTSGIKDLRLLIPGLAAMIDSCFSTDKV